MRLGRRGHIAAETGVREEDGDKKPDLTLVFGKWSGWGQAQRVNFPMAWW